MKNLILTYDIGTTGNKCTIFESSGRALCARTVSYESLYPRPGWSEQRPGDFWDSVVAGTRALFKETEIDPAHIAVIGLSGHMNGCLPVDKNGNALYNDILHSDSRSLEECKTITEAYTEKEYYEITGIRLDPHYTLPKILWLKNNYPDIYRDTAFFLASKDYIAYKLTGNLGITDYSDASMTAMLDIKNRRWSGELLGALGVDTAKLPVLKRSYDLAGYLTGEAAGLLGLVQGTPVVTGGGDGACATKGAGVMRKLQAYNYIGSSSWICLLNDKPILDKDARIFNFYDLDGENCNICGTIQCATISYDWVLNNIGKYEMEEAKANGTNVFDNIDSIAAQVPAGSNGVFFLPYLMGERSPIWDENTKGGFVGFTLFNKREDLFRATYEGIAYALRSVLEVYEENGLTPDQLTLIGGGAKSGLWNSIMSNIYDKKLMIHKNPREATSLGAAVAAGVGVGIFKDFDEAAGMVEFERTVVPEEEAVKLYKKHYKIYKSMYPSLKSVFENISRL